MTVIADEFKLNKDEVASYVINEIKQLEIDNSMIYYNFPFYRGESSVGLVQAHVMFVSKEYGVILFKCLKSIDNITKSDYEKLDELDRHVYSKINKRGELHLNRRDLKINISPYIFHFDDYQGDNELIIGKLDLKTTITNNKKENLSNEEYNLLVAVIEGTAGLKQQKDREVNEAEKQTKGGLLSTMQITEAVYDKQQKRAALNIIDSPQRIRGLAGSGKTIILTMKAALYHLQNPEATILYTYYTKALFGQIKYWIDKFYRDFSENSEPNWDRIQILHGWGGRALKGVYSTTCEDNNIVPINFGSAKSIYANDPFGYVCKELDKHDLNVKYDLTLIDEGQDFPKYFYRVCRKITDNDRVVWAYDDFQNIFDIDIQDEKQTFGKDKNGEFYVDFSRSENSLQDIILYKCYRNPRFALVSAFSLGLGIYNDIVLQRLENNNYWEDLGFEVEEGNSLDGDKMVISRPAKNSPKETNNIFDYNSVEVNVFNSVSEETSFVSNQILNDIKKEKLRADDICVICLDQRNIGNYFISLETYLNNNGISTFNLLDVPSNNIHFSVENHVTLSTINKAKGNEKGMIYIVGVDSIFSNKDYIVSRNKLFTAITRSKGWVSITGYGDNAKICKKELNKLIKKKFKLDFIQPSKRDTKTILRGMTKQQGKLNELTRKLELTAKQLGLSEQELIDFLAKQNKIN
ncbi:DEAD/DEAH box helicase [Tenacibaculum maritimum]|uniref:DEAD/DEAH box helicase n=1 Tax=Tenacibaculum maritimum TaxID=107401 RepID=UPI0012E41606|nr:ATP-binding domain-containing protein [Tenacibaculum maritimum]CAA0193511.1 DNA helicase [Tenacibaculum maritimum]